MIFQGYAWPCEGAFICTIQGNDNLCIALLYNLSNFSLALSYMQ